MTRYQAAIDAGADVTGWINATKTARDRAQAALRSMPSAPRRMTRQEIADVIDRFASLVTVNPRRRSRRQGRDLQRPQSGPYLPAGNARNSRNSAAS